MANEQIDKIAVYKEKMEGKYGWVTYDIAATAASSEDFLLRDGTNTFYGQTLTIDNANESSLTIRKDRGQNQDPLTTSIGQTQRSGYIRLGFDGYPLTDNPDPVILSETSSLGNNINGLLIKVRNPVDTSLHQFTIPYTKEGGEIATVNDVNTVQNNLQDTIDTVQGNLQNSINTINNDYYSKKGGIIRNSTATYQINITTSDEAAAIRLRDNEGNNLMGLKADGGTTPTYSILGYDRTTPTNVFSYHFPYRDLATMTDDNRAVVIKRDLNNYLPINGNGDTLTLNNELFLNSSQNGYALKLYCTATNTIEKDHGIRIAPWSNGKNPTQEIREQGLIIKTDQTMGSEGAMIFESKIKENMNTKTLLRPFYSTTGKDVDLGDADHKWGTIFTKQLYAQDLYNALRTSSDFATFKTTVMQYMDSYVSV